MTRTGNSVYNPHEVSYLQRRRNVLQLTARDGSLNCRHFGGRRDRGGGVDEADEASD